MTSIKIDPEVWKKAKIHALQKGMGIGQLVEAALIHEIQR